MRNDRVLYPCANDTRDCAPNYVLCRKLDTDACPQSDLLLHTCACANRNTTFVMHSSLASTSAIFKYQVLSISPENLQRLVKSQNLEAYIDWYKAQDN